MKKLTIVIPVYFNELNLPDIIPQLINLKNKIPNYELELIFVDDGSKDRSLDILLQNQEKYPKEIKVIKFSRNFGSMAAIQAGFSLATGDCIGVIAADLQDPVDLFTDMIKHWENGIKVVFAVRKERDDPIKEKLFARIFYFMFRKFAISDYPKSGFDFALVDRCVVDEVNKIKEKNTNLFTLIFWLGYNYTTIPYTRKAREKGKSRWTINKKIKLFIDSFVAFSYFPIRLLSVLGLIVAIGSFIYGIVTLYSWSQGLINVQGWTALMIVLTFTAGIQMLMLGVLGEYLWRTLDEVRKRPPYVIEKIF